VDRKRDLIALIALLRAQGRLVEEPMLRAAASDLERWRSSGIAVLAAGDPGYPERLAGLSEAPPLLFVSGSLSGADDSTIAVVGTRQPSPEGLRDAAASAHALVEAGHTVVSGLAVGVDTTAHIAALAAGGRTIAVLGNGLDHVYPPRNARLQAQIATVGGAVVSQFWPELGPTRQSFPLRNALMAGLTLATVIVEAHATSGTRIQARHALEHGRKVILFRRVLAQPWAQTLAQRPGVEVVADADELPVALTRGA
jgi:DNA processing protein